MRWKDLRRKTGPDGRRERRWALKALLDGDAGGSGRGSQSRFFPLRGTRTFRRRPGRDGRSVHLTARHGEVRFVGMDRRKAEATGNDDGGGGRVESNGSERRRRDPSLPARTMTPIENITY